MLGEETIQQLSRRAQEPSWLADWRTAALAEHGRLPWPGPSDEVWRRTDIRLLDPMQGYGLAEPALLQSARLNDRQLKQLIGSTDGEPPLVRVDGAWIHEQAPPGVIVRPLAQAAQEHPELLRPIVEADGFTPSERKLLGLNSAFHQDGLVLEFPARSQPSALHLVRLLSAGPKQALFPLTIVLVRAGQQVTLIDEYIGLPGASPSETVGQPHMINSRIELVVEPKASVRYVRLQRWDVSAHEFLLQRATLQEGAEATLVNLNFGARVSKAHVITKLLGAGASSKIYGFVFGHGRQHIDQHTLQDHQAPHTTSDLLYKAALQHQSRMVYTGLIRIAKTAKQTDAYQANNNLLLSREAKAETIPMLEILADDVRCKHGATIGPVDEEQLFYLAARGIPRDLAERLLVMGFVDPIIQQVPGEALQQRLRDELETGLRAAA